MRSRYAPLALAVVVLAGGVAGCGEDREGSVEPSGGTTGTTGTATTPKKSSGAKPVATVEVKETEYTLFPENPKIDKAGFVRFEVRNAGTLKHALEVEAPGGEVETEGIEPGKTATLEADLSKPGTYTWYCPIGDHKSRGMTGKITVAGKAPPAGAKSGTRGEGSGKRRGSPGQRGGSPRKPLDPPARGTTY